MTKTKIQTIKPVFHWKRRLNGNYPSYVKQAVIDALNGKKITITYHLEQQVLQVVLI